MATANAICTICEHDYDEDEKRPLMLPCGHSCCQVCLKRLEGARDKLCPFCRRNWSNVRVADLPFCYQLLPGNASAISNAGPVLCSEHNSAIQFWCKSCDTPLCKICLGKRHKQCNWILIEDRTQDIKKKYESTIGLLKNCLSPEFEKSLAAVGRLISHLIEHINVLSDLQGNGQEWQTKVHMEIHAFENCSKESHQYEDKELEERLLAAEKLYNDRPAALPATLDQDIANIDTLMGGLLAGETRASPPSNVTASAACLTSPGGVVKNGTEWLVSTSAAAAAATAAIYNKSKRPSCVDITVLNWEEQQLPDLITAISATQCHVRLKLFDWLWKPTAASAAETRSILDAMPTYNNRSVLTLFYGHLDEAAVTRLPDTLRSVGLAIRNENDINAYHRLLDRAFDRRTRPWMKRWANLSEIHLSVDKNCPPEQLRRVGKWEAGGRVWRFTARLSPSDARLSLHLPGLAPADISCVGQTFLALTNDGSWRLSLQKLYLPGTSLGAAAVLEELETYSQQCEVHMPQNQRLGTRAVETMTRRYKQHDCTLLWDLPSM